MGEATHESQSLVQNCYTRFSEEYQNLVNSPHARLHDDQQMLFGVGIGMVGVVSVYFGVQFMLTFSVLTIMGVIGIGLGMAAFMTSRNLLLDAV